MGDEDFNAFLAAALAEGEMPISAGGPPLRAIFPPISSPEFIAAAVAENTLSISAGVRTPVERNEDPGQEERAISEWASEYDAPVLGDGPFLLYARPMSASRPRQLRRNSREPVRDPGSLVDSESTGAVPRYAQV